MEHYKYIYIIIAHKLPQQLARLIEKLQDTNTFFYIHIDLKSSIEEFASIIDMPNVHLIPQREDCIWGDFSIVQAIFNLLGAVAKEHPSGNGHCIFLSGQDYPVKNKKSILDYLKLHSDTNFIELRDINTVWKKEELLKRFDSYRINLSSTKGDYVFLRRPGLLAIRLLCNGKIKLPLFLSLFRKRKSPMELRGGSNWWTLTLDTTRLVNTYIAAHYETLYDYFKYMNCADELVISSIVHNLMKEHANIKVGERITFDDWRRIGRYLPITFNYKEDYDNLIHLPENKLFARKFDMEYNQEILDKLDLYFGN
ncbi:MULTISPECIES: beta-1,6-N-acetylglucosaminyltransferase [Chitinophagaceae]